MLNFKQLESSESQLDATLKRILPGALDQDTFYISGSKIQEKHFSVVDLFVNQEEHEASPGRLELAPSPNSRSVAVVDRTADINQAAKAITIGRLSSRNTSPYCPDLIIVNDFVVEEFVRTCLKYASFTPLNLLEKKTTTSVKELEILTQTAKAEGKAKIHSDPNSGLRIVEVDDR